MALLPKMVDMAKGREELVSGGYPVMETPNEPLYPYGLSICLTEAELAKLNLEDDVEVGDMLHLFALCKVTCVSKTDTATGSNMRVELQITHLAAEGEDEENEESLADQRSRTLYS